MPKARRMSYNLALKLKIVEQQKQDHEINQSADCRVNMSWMCDFQNYRSIMWQHCVRKILIGQFSQMSKQIQDMSNF